ncbi:hypothetical protein DKX38_026603 [Salix brachista]|uniref:Pentatricopeptide repeat-containing protein n=1 Tax=Salix brachista TaxID=2182728 RepID=A0A5N5JF17_9ROSI|nr:hypothetical protein DKX38_026603 [Salix brachista]
MLRFGHKGDNFTYPFVFTACGDLFDVENGRGVHCENAMISGYVKNCEPKDGLRAYSFMRKNVVFPDGTTLLGILSAFAQLVALKQGGEVHGYAV